MPPANMLEHRYDEQTHCTKNEQRAFTLSQENNAKLACALPCLKPKEQIVHAKRGSFNKCLNHTLYIICKLIKN